MYGLGNDFAVIDGRCGAVSLSPSLVAALADRHRGVGFDQFALIEAAEEADLPLIFYNADGSRSAACGNATGCVTRRVMDETGRDRLRIVTERGVLPAVDAGQGLTSVNMGQPQTYWTETPLARDMDTQELPIEGQPTATGMGNPHCTFFIRDAEAADLATFGPKIEKHELFPQRTNVQVAHLIGPTAYAFDGVWHLPVEGSA